MPADGNGDGKANDVRVQEWLLWELLREGSDAEAIIKGPLMSWLRRIDGERFRDLMMEMVQRNGERLLNLPEYWLNNDFRRAAGWLILEKGEGEQLGKRARERLARRDGAHIEPRKNILVPGPQNVDCCDVCGDRAQIAATLGLSIDGTRMLFTKACENCTGATQANDIPDEFILRGNIVDVDA